jgi:hypothetical protein
MSWTWWVLEINNIQSDILRDQDHFDWEKILNLSVVLIDTQYFSIWIFFYNIFEIKLLNI